ncbi:peptidoglycan DD-metalloendopeptidase family protein [Glutamicibacter soli]|uniref:peptidoglycan DD-metalloendopeptidase family protein n=1 Tax=Glutamicibacter soli TaxID=453836 RepID=UPI003FD240F8
MADEVWVDVLANMSPFATGFKRGATQVARDAGRQAGNEFTRAMADNSAGATDGLVKELEISAKKSEAALGKLKQEISTARQAKNKAEAAELDAQVKLNDAISKYGSESAQAQSATLKLAAAKEKAENATRKYENAEAALQEESKAAAKISEQLTEAQKKQTAEVGKAPSKWDKVKSSVGSANDSFKAATGGMGGLITKLTAVAGATALVASGFTSAVGEADGAAVLGASLGATPAEAQKWGAVAGDLYADNFGDSMEGVTGAVDAVVSSMQGMRNASEEQIESITAKALSLEKAMGVGVAESATTAGILIKNGLAKDADQAMDMLAGSMQKVPQAMRGEILPVFDEYSKHFAQLGIDGDTAMGIIVASSQDGAIGMDKMGDALKEFTIRSTDMSKSTAGAYSALGLDMTTMTNDLLAGGDRAEGAMAQIVHGLQEIKDPGEQAAASLALFGTPLEDLGTDQIPNFLGMIDPMGDAFDSTAGAAQQMTDAINSGPTASLESLGRGFQGLIADGIQPFLGPAQEVLNWVTQTPGVMEAMGIGLGGLATAWGIYTVAQWAANSAMLANPITWVVAAIVAGAALVAVAVANWGTIMGWLQTNILEPFLAWIAPAWDGLMTGMNWAWENILKPAWDGIAAAAGWLWTTILQPTFTWISEAWTNWTNNAKWAWDNILKPTWDALAVAAGWLWTSILQPVFGWIGAGWNVLATGIGWAWTNILKPAWDAVSSGASWLWNNALKPAFGWIKSGWDSLTQAFGIVWDKWGKPVFDTIANLLKGDFPAAFKSGKEAVQGIWDSVANIVRKPINFVVNTVYNDGLKAMFNGIAEKLGLGWKLPDVASLPAFADGGQMAHGWKLVGEEGPELINTGPGYVYTAAETKAMLAGKKQAPMESLPTLTGGHDERNSKLPIGGFWSDVWGGVKGTVGAVKDWAVGTIAAGVRALTEPIKGSITAMLPGEGINELIRGAGHKLIDSMTGWAVKKDDAKAAAQVADGGAMFYDGPLGKFAKPASGPITSGFGTSRGRYPHAGIDFAVPIGSAVRAMYDGIIRKTGWNAVTGRTGKGTVMDHTNGLSSYYGHLSGWSAKPGQRVKAGDVIARSGNTGRSTGPHLHAELWRNGTPFNYRSYLYDQGGYVQPGQTQVMNASRSPEPVFNGAQWRSIHNLAARGAEQVQHGGDQITMQLPKDADVDDFLSALDHHRRRNNRGGKK